MACEIVLYEKDTELQRMREAYNSNGLFETINTTLDLDDTEALRWTHYSGDIPTRLSTEQTEQLHNKLTIALSTLMIEPKWMAGSGAPLGNIEKQAVLNRLVNLLTMLRETQRPKSEKYVVVRA
jgi:hypothetical protein